MGVVFTRAGKSQTLTNYTPPYYDAKLLIMDYSEIIRKISLLPRAKQLEIFDFIDFLSNKNQEIQLPDNEWTAFSTRSALTDVSNEPDLYTFKDIKTQ